MSDIVLKVLSAAGILLLAALGVLLAAVLLVLFFPVSYRASGEKSADKTGFRFRASWLFGLLRAGYSYPEPGKAVIKLLWFKLYESGGSEKRDGQGKKRKKDRERESGNDTKNREKGKAAKTAGAEKAGAKETAVTKKAGEAKAGTEKTKTERTGTEKPGTEKPGTEKAGADPAEERNVGPEANGESASWFSQKIAKIQYTFRSVYDKIKEIWQNISYYKDLFSDRETGLLFSHVMFRLGRILKSLRPGKLKAQILFGTGSPDTTGYAFGALCVLTPFLGSSVQVTPDFERAVFEGEFQASGFVTLAALLWHTLQVALDKRLKLFIDRIRRKKPEAERSAEAGKTAEEGSETEARTETEAGTGMKAGTGAEAGKDTEKRESGSSKSGSSGDEQKGQVGK